MREVRTYGRGACFIFARASPYRKKNMSVAVDWKRIRAAKPNNLVDNPDEAHEVFTALAKVGSRALFCQFHALDALLHVDRTRRRRNGRNGRSDASLLRRQSNHDGRISRKAIRKRIRTTRSFSERI